MPTQLGNTERIDLGGLSRETERRLKEVKATWLEFSPNPPSLLVRPDSAEAASAPREVAGELLEFLDCLPEHERKAVAGEALKHLDKETGHYLQRLLDRLSAIKGSAGNTSRASLCPRTAGKHPPTR